MPNAVNIAIAHERLEQLRQIAQRREYPSVAAYLDASIRTEARALGLPLVPPGWEISVATGDAPPYIAFAGPGTPLATLTQTEARSLVTGICDVLDGSRKRAIIRTDLEGEQHVEVARRGRGYTLSITTVVSVTGPQPQMHTRAMNAALLTDIRDALEAVLNEI